MEKESLERLGFVWDVAEKRFEEGLIELRGYFKEYGHTRVPKNFVCLNNDYPLGIWVNGLRARKKNL